MDGEVVIKTPAPDVIEDDQCSPEGLLIFLIENFHEIHWKKIREGDRIKQTLIKELDSLNIQVSPDGYLSKDIGTVLAALDKALTSGRSNIHEHIFKIVNH